MVVLTSKEIKEGRHKYNYYMLAEKIWSRKYVAHELMTDSIGLTISKFPANFEIKFHLINVQSISNVFILYYISFQVRFIYLQKEPSEI